MASAQSSLQQRSAASQLHLPPPQTFDILPALHELLARIDHSTTDSVSNINVPDQTASDSEDIGALYSELQPLEPKELPVEVLQIKTKIRKALKELERLPDMERSVEEQKEEIEALERRITRQREMVAKLADLAKGVREKIG
jgi:uncharacterized coiled-coil protein SlyX